MKDNSYSILNSLSDADSELINFGGQPFYSEGFLVRFFRKNGTSWVGNFNTGKSDIGAVYEYPEKQQAIIFARGGMYLVNTESSGLLKDLGNDYQSIISGNNGELIAYDLTDITVVEPGGEVWQSERISFDGFKDVKIEENSVIGLSWHPMDSEDEWIPFSLNLTTKEVKGGSYHHRGTLKKPWWKIF